VGVRVEANADGGSGTVVAFREGDRGAVTAADGSFKLVGLEGNRVTVGVSDDHGRLAWADPAHRERALEPIAFDLQPGTPRTGVQLIVEARDAWIRGTVLGPDKKPVADAWVRARYQPPKIEGQPEDDGSGGDTTPVLTSADGKFAFEKLRRGTYELTAEGPRGTSRVSKPGVRTGENVTLQLEPLGTLAGKVSDGARPITTYDLTCRSQGHDVGKRIVSSEGTYELERLAPGAYTCSISCDAGTAEGKVDVPSGPAKLDFTVAPWATITGIVVSQHTGDPVAGLHVLAGPDYYDSRSMADLLTGHGPVTDAAGHFTVVHVAAGKGKLAVFPRAAGFEPLAQRDYDVTAGQRLDVGAIKVIPPRSGDAGTLGLGTSIAPAGDAGPQRLVVATVKSGGPAEAAGVKVGDFIVAIDGRGVTEVEAAQQSISSGAVAVGQVVKLVIDRGGKQVQAAVTAVKW
jgi:hypothetical protein